MKTIIFTRIIFTDAAFLATNNLRSINTFLEKTLIKLMLDANFEIVFVTGMLNQLIQDNFGLHYTLELVDDLLEESYNTEYKKVLIHTNLPYISSRVH